MAKFGKWIGAGLGAFAAGPIGAIIGFAIGSLLESDSFTNGSTFSGTQNRQSSTRRNTTSGGYAVSLLVLIAAVMKADGKTLKSELNFVRDYFSRNFDTETANEAISMLRDILQQNIPVVDVCQQIERNMDHSSRLSLLHFLFGIAQADNEINSQELDILTLIHKNLGISEKDFDSIKSMFIKDLDAAYTILEIDSSATNDEIKKAYRKMAIKYHPDKVSHLGEEFQAAATEKFQKVNEAYEELKKQRNFV